MTIHTCDICKKKIKREGSIFIDPSFGYHRHEICVDCGKPILEFLRKNKLIEKGKK